MHMCCTRRHFLRTTGALAGAAVLPPLLRDSVRADTGKKPSAPVSIARCKGYDVEAIARQLHTMTDQLGGLEKLVAGKTVAVKVNLTGDVHQGFHGLPAGRTYHVHPNLVLATALVLDKAGASRIRFLEGTYQLGSFEKYLHEAGWNLKALASLKAKVEYEDTRNLGQGKKYSEVKVPWGGSLMTAYLLNHSYTDCDAYVSLAKLKNHVTAGVTLSMKNNFGITPTAIYSQAKHNERSTSARMNVLHTGAEAPATSISKEAHPNGPRRPTWRVPREVVDMVGVRPIDLAIIDGIETVSGGEGPWVPLTLQKPGLILAGRNPVCTDTIATVVMGYDPMARDGTGAFPGSNHLNLAARNGLGTNNPKEIEVLGVSVKDARHPFGWEPDKRDW